MAVSTSDGQNPVCNSPIASGPENTHQVGSQIRTIKVPVKTCSKCGETFVNGYHGSVGIEYWLDMTIVGGIVYWAVRGRGERCPRCKKRKFSVRSYDLSIESDVVIPTIVQATINMPKEARQETSAPVAPTKSRFCVACGHEILPDSKFCEGCGKKLEQY
jgi:hypothetical protein